MTPAVTDERLRSEPDRWLRVGEVVLDLEGLVVHVGEVRVSLTYREFLVLRALMARAGRVMTRAEILEAAWGDHRPRTRMVDVYVRRVRSRLGDRVTDRGQQQPEALEQHIRAVRGRGYVFDDPGPSEVALGSTGAAEIIVRSTEAAETTVRSADAIPTPRPSIDTRSERLGG